MIGNTLSHECSSRSLHFVFLELGRMTYRRDEAWRCRTFVEKLAFAFKYISQLDSRPPEFDEAFFKELFRRAELANMTKDELLKYNRDMMTQIDYRATISFAKDKGREEGRMEGRMEERTETARKMLALGLDKEVITACTGMDPEELRALGGS